MDSQRVSVVIPVYNSEKFLKESIESVINQTYSDIEIITVNDGSTDGSLEILESYGNKIIIINQQNMGLASAVNAGIKKMSGHWLKWLSPDDVLYPNAVDILVDEAKKLSDNTILYSNWELIDGDGKKLRDFNESNYNKLDNFEFNVRLLISQQINVNTVLIPSSIFHNGCIMRELNDTTLVDYDFFLRAGIIFNSNFYLVEKNLLQYRIHENQTSHKNIIDSLKYLEEIKKEILNMTDEKTRSKYNLEIKNYSKDKKITQKTMELGLKVITNILPNSITDQMLVFYLNKIRSRR